MASIRLNQINQNKRDRYRITYLPQRQDGVGISGGRETGDIAEGKDHTPKEDSDIA